MPLINSEINLISTLYANCVIVYTTDAIQDVTFVRTETERNEKIYVPVLTLSTQNMQNYYNN